MISKTVVTREIRPPLNKNVFPVQRVAEIVTSRAATKSIVVFCMKKIILIKKKEKKKKKKVPRRRSYTHPVVKLETTFFFKAGLNSVWTSQSCHVYYHISVRY